MNWELKIEDGLNNKIVYVQDVDADEMVAECYEGEVEDRIARARLIAAAPEIFQALKEIAEYTGEGGPNTDWQSIVKSITNGARAVIAKATGEAK